MAKKDLSKVTADLAALAGKLPTQGRRSPGGKGRAGVAVEETRQFSFSLRKSLRKELARLAADTDVTMRAYVLLALREKGLGVTDEDLRDLRKERD